MLSIIVCSVNESKLEKFRRNVTETIGDNVPFEIIAHNNLLNPKPLAKVYNECAAKAQYPFLLFSHEDVGFITENWFDKIQTKMQEPSTGVIGFAGTKVVYDMPASWFVDPHWIAVNYIQSGEYMCCNSGPGKPWNQVIALDGFALFARRDVWEENKFDEENLTDFHCYDMDFSMSVARKYRNYVCGCIQVCHESHGNYGKAWLQNTMKMYRCKWHAMLPMMTPDVLLDSKEIDKNSEKAYFRMIKKVAKKNLIPLNLLSGYAKYPASPRHIEHWLKILFYQMRSLLRLMK